MATLLPDVSASSLDFLQMEMVRQFRAEAGDSPEGLVCILTSPPCCQLSTCYLATLTAASLPLPPPLPFLSFPTEYRLFPPRPCSLPLLFRNIIPSDTFPNHRPHQASAHKKLEGIGYRVGQSMFER